ncbi:anti-sigma-I factor RsgI family protein [Fusibacter sp. JL216-2]|uniref:anti-sigma-I factor RsgI family protein n=1 Tax=Fusibacter sp. JL216-2 TaxID=3071453 RepID=UPI003D348BB4
MTGLIMEIREKTVLVMTDNGGFEEWLLDNEALQIGQEIEKPKEQASIIDIRAYIKGGQRQIASIAAMILLVVSLTGVGSYAYYKPSGYVNVDINPSIELTYNRFERVISMRSLNADGALVAAASKGIKNSKLSEAIGQVIDISKSQGFIKENEDNFVLITTTSLDGQTQDVEDEIAVIDKVDRDDLLVETLESDVENYTRASDQGLSPGKKILVEKAKALLEASEDEAVLIDEKTNLGQLIKTIQEEESKKAKDSNGKDSNGKDNFGQNKKNEKNQGLDSDSNSNSNGENGKGNGQGPDKDENFKNKVRDQEKENNKDNNKIDNKEEKENGKNKSDSENDDEIEDDNKNNGKNNNQESEVNEPDDKKDKSNKGNEKNDKFDKQNDQYDAEDDTGILDEDKDLDDQNHDANEHKDKENDQNQIEEDENDQGQNDKNKGNMGHDNSGKNKGLDEDQDDNKEKDKSNEGRGNSNKNKEK